MIKQLGERLAGFQRLLSAVHSGGVALSSSAKGAERERFVELFLAQMFPPSFRFGSGDIVDQRGRSTGQLDVVVELPFLPSFPVAGAYTSRLYLAEGVAAAIEVKSVYNANGAKLRQRRKRLRNLNVALPQRVGLATSNPQRRSLCSQSAIVDGHGSTK